MLKIVEEDVYPVGSKDQKAHTVPDEQAINVLAAMVEHGAPVHSIQVRSYLRAVFKCGLKHDKNPAHKSVPFLQQNNT